MRWTDRHTVHHNRERQLQDDRDSYAEAYIDGQLHAIFGSPIEVNDHSSDDNNSIDDPAQVSKHDPETLTP